MNSIGLTGKRGQIGDKEVFEGGSAKKYMDYSENMYADYTDLLDFADYLFLRKEFEDYFIPRPRPDPPGRAALAQRGKSD
jgi:hypothetical protein